MPKSDLQLQNTMPWTSFRGKCLDREYSCTFKSCAPPHQFTPGKL